MLFIHERTTLQAGDDGPDNVKIQNLDSTQLPELEELNEAHHAGGAVGEVEWGNLGMKALAPSFKVKGWDPQIMSLMGRKERTPWTIRGSIRDKQRQKLIGVRAIIFGRLGKIAPESHEAGKSLGHDHSLHEVTHYQLFFDNVEKYYWDFFECAFRIDGNDMLADERAILALPGA